MELVNWLVCSALSVPFFININEPCVCIVCPLLHEPFLSVTYNVLVAASQKAVH